MLSHSCLRTFPSGGSSLNWPRGHQYGSAWHLHGWQGCELQPSGLCSLNHLPSYGIFTVADVPLGNSSSSVQENGNERYFLLCFRTSVVPDIEWTPNEEIFKQIDYKLEITPLHTPLVSNQRMKSSYTLSRMLCNHKLRLQRNCTWEQLLGI